MDNQMYYLKLFEFSVIGFKCDKNLKIIKMLIKQYISIIQQAI